MAEGSKKLVRLVKVFHDLVTLERAKIAELAREMDSLREMQNAIFRQLEQPASFHGPFMGLFSSRIGRIERQLDKLSRERETALKSYAAASARERTAARLAADARGGEARQAEQRELEALLEFKQAAAQGRGKSERSI